MSTSKEIKQRLEVLTAQKRAILAKLGRKEESGGGESEDSPPPDSSGDQYPKNPNMCEEELKVAALFQSIIYLAPSKKGQLLNNKLDTWLEESSQDNLPTYWEKIFKKLDLLKYKFLDQGQPQMVALDQAFKNRFDQMKREAALPEEEENRRKRFWILKWLERKALIKDKLSRESGVTFRILCNTLVEMIKRTVFTVDKNRPTIQGFSVKGVFLKIEGKQIEMVATDGSRLACVIGEIVDPLLSDVVSIIVPPKFLHEVKKQVRKQHDVLKSVKVTLTEEPKKENNQILVHIGTTVLSSPLIEERFPEYKNLLPNKEFNKKIMIDRKCLIDYLKQVDIKNECVNFYFSKNSLLLRTRSINKNKRSNQATLKPLNMNVSYSGKDFHIAYNPKFILDVLKVLNGNEIILELESSEEYSKGMIHEAAGVNNHHDGPNYGLDYVYLIMPIVFK